MSNLGRLKWAVIVALAFGVTMWLVAYGAMLARYVAFGVRYGDWLNDWLTHLPAFVQAIALEIVMGG